MDPIVDALNTTYHEFLNAACQAHIDSNAEFNVVTALLAAKENIELKWKLFKVTCDQAEQFVALVKLKVATKSMAEEAARLVSKVVQPVTMTPDFPSVSSVELDEMGKTVQRLMLKLQNVQDSELEECCSSTT